MIIRLEAESHEMFPPMMAAQIEKAIAAAVQAYGLRPVIKANYENKTDAEQRWWAWLKQEQEKDGG